MLERYRPRRLSPGAWKAIVYALMVHLAALAVFTVSLRLGQPERIAPTPQAIEAVVVSPPVAPSAASEAQAEAGAEVHRRRQQEEQARRARQEAERQQQLALQRRQQEEEERRRREAQEQAERRRAALREAERKKQAEAEEKARRQREAALRQKQAEAELQEALAAEERARAEAARGAQALAAAGRYERLIRQKVERHWSRPAGSRQGLECIVRVRLAPGGEVLEARVVRSSGNAVFDRSVESAVYKAAPLPLPESPELFGYFRELEFIFRPEGG